jgi:hypothetical protein
MWQVTVAEYMRYISGTELFKYTYYGDQIQVKTEMLLLMKSLIARPLSE